MTKFTNRIAAQRHLLLIINTSHLFEEELFGLSQKAIERWAMTNQISPNQKILTLIKEAAAKLFFLANHSQQHITEEYMDIVSEVETVGTKIQKEIKDLNSKNRVS